MWQSDLYTVPKAVPAGTPLTNDELLLLVTVDAG